MRARADEINRQPSKFAPQKEKGFSKDYEKDMKNPIKSPKFRQTCGQQKTADFVENIEKQPKTSQNSLFSAVFGRSGG